MVCVCVYGECMVALIPIQEGGGSLRLTPLHLIYPSIIITTPLHVPQSVGKQ